ncbi:MULTISPECIES: DUF3307 domain-containing protein [unclassified Streptomyces]|uniref:DUF3307 domain-containing protein n=1 Tax=unclassified Streptomyces TaxID=2593676 RepID=UPI00081BA31A|nr:MULTISPECIES: DUF3307 domain-containing protein [unclassified Streptomyces]MYQ82687.1 DUF3307 domain-containing protein [Streptomyces sp. SID4936]SCD50723.1 Protein of unknown function [Streptomyces sp. DvalAA-43]
MTSATVFAAVFAVLFASHVWADHCWQTDSWAAAKGRPESEDNGPTVAESWRALLAHITVYHLVMAVMLAVTAALLDLPISWAGAAAGIAFSAVSHGFWDRRWPVKAWMVLTGSSEFAKNPQGRYSVDQAQHVFCLWVSALLITLV